MREFKFEYLLKDKGGNIAKEVFTLENIEEENFNYNNLDGYEVVARRQYTGLKDKNGVEIYEGDFCRHIDQNGEKIGIVEWLNELNAFRIVFVPNWSYYFVQDIDEVIGNIYENPELLDEIKKW